MPIGLDNLRRFAVARSLFPPVPLKRALRRLGFVQADPIRAPARAQDLTLRHRAVGYRAGDLERLYPSLGIEEDIFINYGFVTSDVSALMHPRKITPAWPAAGRSERRTCWHSCVSVARVHPREAHRALRAWDRHELLGRVVERDDASARRPPLPRSVTRRGAGRRHSNLCGTGAPASSARP